MINNKNTEILLEDKYNGGYKELELPDINNKMNQLIDNWKFFLQENAPNLVENKDYFIHKRNLVEVIRRVDKRKAYYEFYHKTDKICEHKEVAITAFWIITLKPFLVVNDTSSIYNSPNELFAYYLIFSLVRGLHDEYYPERNFIEPSNERIIDILYDFKYGGLSRESMIAFVETFADIYGVGIEKIIEKKKTNKT